MKKAITILMSIFLSALIVYGGSGVNAYFYCCNDCRTEGVAAVSEHKCCEIHHHHHLNGLVTHFDDHSCNQEMSVPMDECGVERFSMNLNFSSDNDIQFQPAVLDINSDYLYTFQNIEIGSNSKELTAHTPSQKPPNLSKDDYFSLLTTLII